MEVKRDMPGEDKLLRSWQQFRAGLQGMIEVLGDALPIDKVEVKAGDTLWKLAEQHLGDGQRWRELYFPNLDVIVRYQQQHGSMPGPDTIFPGQQLVFLAV
jgi:nucleoid-associated protein YgaU